MSAISVRDLIDCLLTCPPDAAVFFADGDEVADEPASGLTAWRVSVESVETMTFRAHDEETVGYVRLVGKQRNALGTTPETEKQR